MTPPRSVVPPVPGVSVVPEPTPVKVVALMLALIALSAGVILLFSEDEPDVEEAVEASPAPPPEPELEPRALVPPEVPDAGERLSAPRADTSVPSDTSDGGSGGLGGDAEPAEEPAPEPDTSDTNDGGSGDPGGDAEPAEEPTPEPDTSDTNDGDSGDDAEEPSSIAEHWLRLADCESGNWLDGGGHEPGSARWDWAKPGTELPPWGTTLHHGGLQFNPDTWDWVAPDVLDDPPAYAYDATPEQQVAVAEETQRRQGWGAWPVCSKRVGLR